MKAIDYSNKKGMKFGFLTFTGEFKSDKKRGRRWGAICVCGKTIWHPFAVYKAGKCKSCGCKKGKIKPGLASKNRVFDTYKTNSKKRNLMFDINFIRFIEIIIKPCYYCGEAKTSIQKGTNGDFLYTGIDRLNSDKGYFKGNCVPCCGICNRMKWALSEKEFLTLVTTIYQHKIQ